MSKEREQLIDLLEKALEFIADHEDVTDGDDGPLPNRAMSLATELRAALASRDVLVDERIAKLMEAWDFAQFSEINLSPVIKQILYEGLQAVQELTYGLRDVAAGGSNADSLHAAIMNLPCMSNDDIRHLYRDNPVGAYKSGHRDARHAAAELVLSAGDEKPAAQEWQEADSSDCLYSDRSGAVVPPQPPSAQGEYTMHAGACSISGPREDVLHIGKILHAAEQRAEPQEVLDDHKAKITAAKRALRKVNAIRKAQGAAMGGGKEDTP